MKLSTNTILNASTVIGGLIGSYVVHSRNQMADKPLTFWENEAWVAAFSIAGRIIGNTVIQPTTAK